MSGLRPNMLQHRVRHRFQFLGLETTTSGTGSDELTVLELSQRLQNQWPRPHSS